MEEHSCSYWTNSTQIIIILRDAIDAIALIPNDTRWDDFLQLFSCYLRSRALILNRELKNNFLLFWMFSIFQMLIESQQVINELSFTNNFRFGIIHPKWYRNEHCYSLQAYDSANVSIRFRKIRLCTFFTNLNRWQLFSSARNGFHPPSSANSALSIWDIPFATLFSRLRLKENNLFMLCFKFLFRCKIIIG